MPLAACLDLVEQWQVDANEQMEAKSLLLQ